MNRPLISSQRAFCGFMRFIQSFFHHQLTCLFENTKACVIDLSLDAKIGIWMRDQTTCHLSHDPVDPSDAPSNSKNNHKAFYVGGRLNRITMWQMYKELQINTLLVVEGNNATMSHTHRDVIWVIQQWTMVLILLMTKTSLSPLMPLTWLAPVKGHNLRIQQSVGRLFLFLLCLWKKKEMKGTREG